jgi:hypothetical protein
VYAAAPRVERRFLEALIRLDDRSLPIAETYRRSRDLADRMGVPRPSYEHVRLHLQAARRRELARKRARDLLFELAYNTRAADQVGADLLELLE